MSEKVFNSIGEIKEVFSKINKDSLNKIYTAIHMAKQNAEVDDFIDLFITEIRNTLPYTQRGFDITFGREVSEYVIFQEFLQYYKNYFINQINIFYNNHPYFTIRTMKNMLKDLRKDKFGIDIFLKEQRIVDEKLDETLYYGETLDIVARRLGRITETVSQREETESDDE